MIRLSILLPLCDLLKSRETNLLGVVVAQLVEWSLPTPEVCRSNPIFGKILYVLFTVNYVEKMKIK